MIRAICRVPGKIVAFASLFGAGGPSGDAYLRPGGVDYYKRPGGTDFYLRP
jgi:hypothetical protein